MASPNIIFLNTSPNNDGSGLGTLLSAAPSLQAALKDIKDSFIRKHPTEECDCDYDMGELSSEGICLIFPETIIEYDMSDGTKIREMTYTNYQEVLTELKKIS